ncbi:ABC transporter ATP-binding protein [Cyclobacterium salsum]|uniref:ABC transporter ATP-binding protein n=1 Tax=Cyclobacterium salsum TaxID=2666329 RepID=UPI0013918766|nr:polysaccharide ABC transporter ATP-binding protein [Cyclobacterium salsum]
MSAILKVENVSKVYQLGQTNTGTLKKDLHRWWAVNVQKKEDPFAIESYPNNTQSDTLWALKDISFEVNQGDILGIVGSNGSGKSTLLKILSRIVRPTSGTVRGKGKVNSLLEIGTGFNWDLTGRENIFISGYFLGMKKQEIQQCFDEIVAFSGVERFIDTPVKHYSSGMYMRLAFSVAAHLEPDILIVDEVLAVGDAEFQTKCLKKMEEASHLQGRTILFVSHDAQVVSNLCHKALWLDKGEIRENGETQRVVDCYLASLKEKEVAQVRPENAESTIQVKSMAVTALGKSQDQVILVHDPIEIQIELSCFTEGFNIEVGLALNTQDGTCVFDLGSPTIKAEVGEIYYTMQIPEDLLNAHKYTISLMIHKSNAPAILEFKNLTTFEIQDFRERLSYFGSRQGIIRPRVQVELLAKMKRTNKNPL